MQRRAPFELPPLCPLLWSNARIIKLSTESLDALLNGVRQTAAASSRGWFANIRRHAVVAVRSHAAGHGLDGRRLLFSFGILRSQYLARAAHADLLLDTPRVNAHSTGTDTLFAGVPLVTLSATAMMGRVGASLVDALGTPSSRVWSLREMESVVVEGLSARSIRVPY